MKYKILTAHSISDLEKRLNEVHAASDSAMKVLFYEQTPSMYAWPVTMIYTAIVTVPSYKEID